VTSPGPVRPGRGQISHYETDVDSRMTTRSAATPRALADFAWLGLASLLNAAQLPHDAVPAGLLGAWKARDGGTLLLVEPTRVVVADAGRLSAKGIVGFGEGKLYLRSGLVEVWSVTRANGSLHAHHGAKAVDYDRLDRELPELTIRPRRLAEAKEPSAERKGQIQGELRARVKQDQDVRKPPFDTAKMAPVDAANTACLRALVAEVGWIDVARFGIQASGDAFLLLQHSEDLSLQLAVLPLIERDARAVKDFGQAYALLYDRTQVDLGLKQRYGSQIGADAKGNPVVFPLQDPAKVDAFLAELGLSALKDYLAVASKALFSGKPIRVAGDDDLEAATSSP
jgi:hypothetical protein